MKSFSLLLSFLLLSTSSLAQTAESILEKADNIRNPSDSFVMDVTVSNVDSTFKYQIKMGGKNRSLIKTLSPKREYGKNYLMVDQDMWVYIPNIRRSIRVALHQKMAGQFSNGDIGRMRWFGNYDAKIFTEDDKYWVLELTAKKKGLTYEGIRVWVEKSSHRPLKAEYLAKSGRPLKYISFEGYRDIAGNIRPTLFVIRDADNSKNVSKLIVDRMVKANISKATFTKRALK